MMGNLENETTSKLRKVRKIVLDVLSVPMIDQHLYLYLDVTRLWFCSGDERMLQCIVGRDPFFRSQIQALIQ